MKIEESLDYFKRRKEMYLHDTCQQHEDNAIQALEKRVQKEPIRTTVNEPVLIGGWWYRLGSVKYKCQCGTFVKQDQKYCDECGQRLK